MYQIHRHQICSCCVCIVFVRVSLSRDQVPILTPRRTSPRARSVRRCARRRLTELLGQNWAETGKQSGPTGAVPHPYMMHMFGRGQWVRQGSMRTERSDARVSGEYATKGLVGERRGKRLTSPSAGTRTGLSRCGLHTAAEGIQPAG